MILNPKKKSGLVNLTCGLGMAFASLTACDSDEKSTEPVEDEELREVREEAGLHPADKRDDVSANAEELKDDASLHQEGEDPPPETAEEIREEAGLAPPPE